VSLIEIKNLFLEGELDETGSNMRNTELRRKNTEQDELKEIKRQATEPSR